MLNKTDDISGSAASSYRQRSITAVKVLLPYCQMYFHSKMSPVTVLLYLLSCERGLKGSHESPTTFSCLCVSDVQLQHGNPDREQNDQQASASYPDTPPPLQLHRPNQQPNKFGEFWST